MAKSKFTKKSLEEFAAEHEGAFNKRDVFDNTPVSGNRWHLFYEDYDKKLQVWLPDDIANSSMSVADKIKKINAAFASAKNKSKYNLYDAARSTGIAWDWYDITESRLKLLSAIIEGTQNAKALASGKSTELTKAEAELAKAKKKVDTLKKKAADSTKISDNTLVKKNVAFVKIDNSKSDAFKYVRDEGTVDMCFGNLRLCDKENQIDHVINMFKKRAAQTNDLVAELEAAKKAGAEYVIDEQWCSATKFTF